MIGNVWISERETRAKESIAAAARAVSARAGIITGVTNPMIELDDPRIFHAVASVTDTSRLYGNASALGNSGAGLTQNIARASAIGEALERYCCASYDTRSLIVSSFNELRLSGRKAVHPRDFPLYSETQYRRPEFIFHHFTEDVSITWTSGYSLVRDEPVLVPACLVYVPFKYDHSGDLIAFGVTTGLCCGRSRLEAILGGLYEVVERDAIMIMWMNQLPCRRIALGSGARLSAIVEERFVPSGLGFYLNDITTDLPIPVAFASIIDRTRDGLAVAVGAAANLDPEAAALKALIEAAQGRRWLKLMNQQNAGLQFREDFRDVVSFDDHVRLFGSAAGISRLGFLIDGPEEIDIKSVKTKGSSTVKEDLKHCLTALAENGMDVVAVDVTLPDVAELGFSVVKVLIPGLIDINADHNYPLLGGERLYTVPRRLGFVGHDTKESTLTKIPHPFP
ncbi:MAG TPA: YcaO-like family protein [Paraburkholderia sp.]|uniref:YcaO-like family protein n=1 Tax=Paraburkholderia sp. TaxID=1926495 RepID=UPI002B459CAF|nr:YcaO-like family protein [Paraburkholderia sp.]HKR41082.1 YcaO-like family protein [Paraburkholderia sp.]